MSAHQKVGTFQKIGNAKVGGNVACYFCRSDGTVIRAIPGRVDEATFLSEVRFAVELHNAATFQMTAGHNKDSPKSKQNGAYAAAIKKGFADRVETAAPAKPIRGWKPTGGQQGMVNALLYQTPLPRLELLYPYVWEKVLGEKLSAAPIAVR